MGLPSSVIVTDQAVCLILCLHMCVCMYVNVLGGQKRVLESLGLELQGGWVAGNQTWVRWKSSKRF